MIRHPRFHRFTAGTLAAALALGSAAAAAPPPPPPTAAVLAETFSWSEFVKYWRKQMGRTSGVFGTVFMVGGIAFLIIMSKGRKL